MKLISNLVNCPQDRLYQRVKVRCLVRFLRNKSMLMTSLLIYGICFGTVDAAFASRCKDVKIVLSNNSSNSIKVIKFEYFDFDKGKFRTELLQSLRALVTGSILSSINVDEAKILIDPGKSVSEKENLADIGDQKTFFKVTYQKRNAGFDNSSFSSSITRQTTPFICKDNSTHTVNLD